MTQWTPEGGGELSAGLWHRTEELSAAQCARHGFQAVQPLGGCFIFGSTACDNRDNRSLSSFSGGLKNTYVRRSEHRSLHPTIHPQSVLLFRVLTVLEAGLGGWTGAGAADQKSGQGAWVAGCCRSDNWLAGKADWNRLSRLSQRFARNCETGSPPRATGAAVNFALVHLSAQLVNSGYMENITDPFENRRQFGALLKELRTRANLSLRDLAKLAELTHSTVFALEEGSKVAGPEIAERLANGLALFNAVERDQFLLQAAATRTKDKLMACSRQTPPEVVNYLPRRLQLAGVNLGTIRKCRWDHAQDQSSRLVLELDGGQQVSCSVTVQQEPSEGLEKRGEKNCCTE